MPKDRRRGMLRGLCSTGALADCHVAGPTFTNDIEALLILDIDLVGAPLADLYARGFSPRFGGTAETAR
jgi:hypothetical protein